MKEAESGRSSEYEAGVETRIVASSVFLHMSSHVDGIDRKIRQPNFGQSNRFSSSVGPFVDDLISSVAI